MRFLIRLVCTVVPLIACGPRTTADPHDVHSLDDACETKGFTARSVLQRYPSHMVATTQYQTMRQPGSDISIDVTYEGGKVACTPSYLPPDGSRFSLPASLSIEVTVHVATSDGLFVETMRGTLVGNDRPPTRPGFLGDTVQAGAPASDNTGTYKASLDRLELFYGMDQAGNIIVGGINETTADHRTESRIAMLCSSAINPGSCR